MLERLKSYYRIFTIGQSVANPAAWKKGQITGQMVAVLLGAVVTLARAKGINISLSDADLVQLGSAFVIVGGLLSGGVTVASSPTIGLPSIAPGPSKPDVPSVPASVSAAMPPIREARNGDDITTIDPHDRI